MHSPEQNHDCKPIIILPVPAPLTSKIEDMDEWNALIGIGHALVANLLPFSVFVDTGKISENVGATTKENPSLTKQQVDGKYQT